MNNNFDENLAEQLKERYKLAPGTIRVWKTRGKIPARYLQEGGYEQPEAASQAQLQRILSFLEQHPYITRSGFEGLGKHRLRDLLAGSKHTRLRQVEAKAIILQIKRIERKAADIISEKSLPLLLEFIKMPQLKPLVWLGDYKLFNRLRQGLQELKEADWLLILDKLARFA